VACGRAAGEPQVFVAYGFDDFSPLQSVCDNFHTQVHTPVVERLLEVLDSE
jgi:hypothetical protein